MAECTCTSNPRQSRDSCRGCLRADLAAATARAEKLVAIARDLHWMARRYADGRQSYATSLFNEHTRALVALGVDLNPTGDGTVWARDAHGRGCDHLSDDEAAQGRPPYWWHNGPDVREENDRLAAENAALRAAFIRHRTATHEVKPTFCATCQESDAILATEPGQHGAALRAEIDRLTAEHDRDWMVAIGRIRSLEHQRDRAEHERDQARADLAARRIH